MSAETIRVLIEYVKSLWPCRGDLEVSLEANPTHGEAERFKGFAEAGVTRLSLGIQSLDDAALKWLGRWHTADDARRAFEAAQPHFDTVSLDLIYGRPGQTANDWQGELAKALSWQPAHLSLYQLTIEAGTAFAKAQDRGALVMPPDDVLAGFYQLSQELCEAAGLSAYEVSNHAKPGSECRHNLAYWRAQDYVGVGPGAHGRLTIDGERCATETTRAPRAWLEAVERQGHALETIEALPRNAQAAELLLMGLRIEDGISLALYEEVAGAPLAQSQVGQLIAEGLLREHAGRLQATARGRLGLNAVVVALAP
jgi:oxygen-independent coproporphyrinogen-3 oxidase